MIAIIDYGMGNIHSVQKALECMGAKTVVTNNPGNIKACEKAVLPGVGAFDDAMLELKKQGLISAINKHIESKKVFLGICLGMQLLFEESQEANKMKGLGILKGGVRKFKAAKSLKVPHMGWNQLRIANQPCPLFKNVPHNSYVYFCHSYYPQPENKRAVAATCDYGGEFTCAIWQDNIYGVQFHPEKSQGVGLKMLKNFVELC